MWLPHIFRILMQTGWRAALWNPQNNIDPHAHWAQRAKRAQRNAARHLAIFGLLVLIAHISGADPVLVGNLVLVWLGTRLAHFVSFVAGVPTLPQIFFFTNWLIVVALAVELILPGSQFM
jgi:uncharacterized MAPEG superfamily protein